MADLATAQAALAAAQAAVAAATPAVPATPAVTPGYKTTEFWLSTLATFCGVLMASGVITSGSTFDKGIGLVVAALTSMGYAASRATVKSNA